VGVVAVDLAGLRAALDALAGAVSAVFERIVGRTEEAQRLG
jgi:hypothetical protein